MKQAFPRILLFVPGTRHVGDTASFSPRQYGMASGDENVVAMATFERAFEQQAPKCRDVRRGWI